MRSQWIKHLVSSFTFKSRNCSWSNSVWPLEVLSSQSFISEPWIRINEEKDKIRSTNQKLSNIRNQRHQLESNNAELQSQNLVLFQEGEKAF